MSPAMRRRVLPWAITLGFFVLWQLVCMVFRIDVFILPAPTEVIRSFLQYTGPSPRT